MTEVHATAKHFLGKPPAKFLRDYWQNMRRHGLPNPYEQLKALTRGQGITEASMREFIASLDLPEADKRRLLEITPAGYTGLAEALAKTI